MRRLLTQSRQFAQAMPPDSRRDALLDLVQRREQLISVANPFGGIDLDYVFEGMFGEPDDEDDYDDDGW